jgi:hypothetical protein
MTRTTILAPLFLLIFVGEALAISRHDVAGFSCAKVQAILQSEGAAILRYRSKRTGNTLYDRYVSGHSYCSRSQVADTTSVPTADRESCRVKKCIARVTQR